MTYLIKRLLLIPPTVFAILCINFAIVQTAPTGPIESQMAKIKSEQQALVGQGFGMTHAIQYQGREGLSQEMMHELTVRFGFDKPWHERFYVMIKNYACFELGESFFKGQSVSSLIWEKLPISLLFGGLNLLVMYGFGIFIGVIKVRFYGGWFDRVSAIILSLWSALPVFVVALVLITLFAGARFWQIFPMQVTLEGLDELSFFDRVVHLLHELSLPVIASSLGGIASIAYLTKFSLSKELSAPYVLNARAMGFSDRQIMTSHVFKNALIPMMSDMPMVVVSVLFAGNFVIETMFGIDGVGRLGYEAMMSRDYPVMFGVLYLFSLVAVLVSLMFDVIYHLIDGRVNYR